MNLDILNDILYQNGIENIRINESLKEHTSIKIGGFAKLFVEVKNEKQLIKLLEILNDTKTQYYILGNGTNTLASDNGFDGVVISTKKLNHHRITQNGIFVGCGLGLFSFNKLCRKFGLSGLEFTYGIPGSIGGAMVTNAGAFSHNISEYIDYVLVLKDGKIKKLKTKDMQFGYRTSIIEKQNLIVLGAKFLLKYDSPKNIENLQNEFFQKKLSTQPYNDLSFGSVFKRKENFEPISKIIDELGLKGYKIGGAEISKIHAGFIVNSSHATCQDCLLLIKYIQKKIFERYGFVPEPEVKFLGV